MKKVLSFVLTIVLLLSVFCGCQKEPPKLPDSIFSDSPYQVVVEGKALSNEEIKALVDKVPNDRYEKYAELHTSPLTATLYKSGEKITLDVNDKRIIGLMNLYNNSVYYRQYSYTQGLLSIDYIEKYSSEEFRLVLTFEPDTETVGVGYDTNILRCDTFVVTNKWFVIIAHDSPGYEGAKDEYPYAAYGHSPLYMDYPWLDLFGF